MSEAKYSKLIDGICEMSKAKATPSPERHERCDLPVDGTLFTLIPSRDGNGDIDGMVYFGDFGPLPQQNKEAAAIQLLETNLYMVGQDSPSFCCNPETGHVVLAGRMALDRVTVETALQVLSAFARSGSEWRALHLAARPPQPGNGVGRAGKSPVGA